MTRRFSIHNLAVTTLAMMAASVALLAPQAAADPGDVTTIHTSTNVEFSTDACRGAFGQVVMEGAPGVPDNYYVAFGGVGCVVRARFVGVAGDGVTPVDSGYHVNSRNNGVLGLGEVYRCHVEFGVRRANGTFYTQIVRPAGAGEVRNCPR